MFFLWSSTVRSPTGQLQPVTAGVESSLQDLKFIRSLRSRLEIVHFLSGQLEFSWPPTQLEGEINQARIRAVFTLQFSKTYFR